MVRAGPRDVPSRRGPIGWSGDTRPGRLHGVTVRSTILSAEEVSPVWLTEILADAGIGGGATITTLTGRPIGTGQVGESVRFTLQWSSDDPSLPASVVGKFPSKSELSRAAAAATRTYVR